MLELTFSGTLEKGSIILEDTEVEVVNNIKHEDLEHIVKLVNKGMYGLEGLSTLERLGSGGYGEVYGYKEYAIKFIHQTHHESYDAKVLKDLQHLDFIPKLYAIIGERALVVKRVRGMTVYKFMNDVRESRITNFINPEFNIKYEEMIKDILQSGYEPHDLHEKNVMIDEETKLPVIVDVGLFTPIKDEEKFFYENREKINIKEFEPTYNTHGWIMRPMQKYIDEVTGKYDLVKEQKELEEGYVENLGNLADIGELLNMKDIKEVRAKSITPSYIEKFKNVVKGHREGRLQLFAGFHGKGKTQFNVWRG